MANAALEVEIVTPGRVAYKGLAAEVQAPGVLGEFGVLPDHAAMLSLTRPGLVTLFADDGVHRFVVGEGFAEVGPDRISLLVSLCQDASSVDVDAARRDLDDAEGRLSEAEPDTDAWRKAERDALLASARLSA